MTIRPASPEDHAALAELFLAARKAAFTWCDPDSFALGDLHEETEGEAIHLAEDEDGRVLGFISVWEAENFVHHLFVSPGYVRRGVGRALLEDLARRRVGPFTLKCVIANTSALAFYRKLGWREIGSGSASEGRYLLLEWSPRDEGLTWSQRPGTADDLDFLWELHVATMQDYAEQTWGWDCVWQEDRFRSQFDPTKLEILEIGGEPVGVISVAEEPDHVFLRLIEIHPDWQNRGIGRTLVARVIERARELKVPVKLQVLKVNPARRFYERLGFQVCGETETHFLMEHRGASTGEIHDRLDNRGDDADRSGTDGEGTHHAAALGGRERYHEADQSEDDRDNRED